jgi:hypothetical protein
VSPTPGIAQVMSVEGPTESNAHWKTTFIPVFILAVALLSAPFALRAQIAAVCDPTPEVKAALDRLPSYQTADQTDYQYRQARRSALADLMRQYPVFIQRAYIRNMSYPRADHLKGMAEYKALHEQHPDDAQIACLYAQTLLGRDSPQAIKLLTAALQRAPNFPGPHLTLALPSTPRKLFSTRLRPLPTPRRFFRRARRRLTVTNL